jgi:hypothetical protein
VRASLRRNQSTEHLHIRLRALVDRLGALQRDYERARDSRAVFTLIYGIMTAEVDRHLERMDLLDPDWIVELAEVFANRYFAALAAVDGGRSPGRAWQAVFDALRSRSSVLEDAVFPMTAHIVHDLPLALLDVGFDRPGAASRLHDFDRINGVMEQAISVIRQRVTRRYSPGLRFLDRMERHYDVVLSGYGIRVSRAQAWYDALRLRDASLRSTALHGLESRPIELIESVHRTSGTAVGLLFAALRRVAAMFRRWPAQPPEVAA